MLHERQARHGNSPRSRSSLFRADRKHKGQIFRAVSAPQKTTAQLGQLNKAADLVIYIRNHYIVIKSVFWRLPKTLPILSFSLRLSLHPHFSIQRSSRTAKGETKALLADHLNTPHWDRLLDDLELLTACVISSWQKDWRTYLFFSQCLVLNYSYPCQDAYLGF